MISVVVVDDQAMVRQALAAVIDLEPDIRVVGQAGDAAAALELVARSRPDVVVLDVQLSASAQPGADGLTCAGRIRELAAGTRVLVVTTFARPGYLARAMAAGADGACGSAGDRPAGGGGQRRGWTQPAHRTRAAGARGRRHRGHHRADRPAVASGAGHGAQHPVDGHAEGGRRDKGGGGTHRHRTRVVVLTQAVLSQLC
jgi:chemotaxis response regulator CheB